jgi:hypothetical protein
MEDEQIDYSNHIPPECWVIVLSHPEICRNTCGWSYQYGPIYGSACPSEFLALRTVSTVFYSIASEQITNFCIYDDKLERLGGLECFPASIIDGGFRKLVELHLGELNFVPYKKPKFTLNPEKNVYDLVPDETDRGIEAKPFMDYLFFIIDRLQIQKLRFAGGHVAEFYERLGQNTTLTSLTLIPQERTVGNFLTYSQYLTNNTALTALKIRWVYEPDYSIVNMLFNGGFNVFKNLTKFCLEAEDENLGEELTSNVIPSIFMIFKNLRSLKLNRFSTYLKDDWIVKLTTCINATTTLTQLDLVGSQDIEDPGAKLIGAALGKNTTLKHLSLQDSCIGNSGATSIAKGLSTNTTLCSLNFAFNPVSNMGAQAFVLALQHNTTLTKLDLDGSHGEEDFAGISDDLLQEINGLIERNRTIQNKKKMPYRPHRVSVGDRFD